MLLERTPTHGLASYVEKLWYCDSYTVPHRRERVLPTGKFQLIIDLAPTAAPAIVVGMQSRFSVVDTVLIQSVIGILFRPGGARAFFDVPADEFYNRVVRLDSIWGRSVDDLRIRLLEAATPAQKFDVVEEQLWRKYLSRLQLHAAVRYGLEQLRHVPHVDSIADLSKDAGLSRRRFSHLFREQVGLTPKLYCRLHRFQGVVRRIAAGAPVDWADVALAAGYCDQAHLANEFHEFSGISPGTYASGDRPFQNHVVID